MKASEVQRFTAIVLAVLLLLLTGALAVANQSIEQDTGPFQHDRVIDVRIVMPDTDWKYMREHPLLEQYVRADFWCDGVLTPDVAVRPKGNSSLKLVARTGSERASLKVDFNFFNAARTLGGVKKVNLNNGFRDPALIKEVLSYNVYGKMGVPTPRTAFVDLWVNDTHMGLYTMVEQIDKTFLSAHFEDGDGNLYKPVSPGAYLNWTEEDVVSQPPLAPDAADSDVNLGGGKYEEIIRALQLCNPSSVTAAKQADGKAEDDVATVHVPSRAREDGQDYLASMGLKTNEHTTDHSALFRLLEVLNLEPDETFRGEIEKVLDVDQVLRWLAVSTALVHLDNYTGQFGHNYYLYENCGVFTILPWDLNGSFGGFDAGIRPEALINFYIDEPTVRSMADRPLVGRLLAQPEYLDVYHDYLRELVDGPFSPDVMNAEIDRYADLIRPYVEADDLKFHSSAAFERALGYEAAESVRTSGIGLDVSLKTFVELRCESIRMQLDGLIASRSAGGTGNTGRRAASVGAHQQVDSSPSEDE